MVYFLCGLLHIFSRAPVLLGLSASMLDASMRCGSTDQISVACAVFSRPERGSLADGRNDIRQPGFKVAGRCYNCIEEILMNAFTV